MENKITQPVFYETLSKENYSGWRIFFAEHGSDHKGAEIFAKFIKETLDYDLEKLQNIPASYGDSVSNNPINPQAFIDYLNGNNKENKQYPELIEKLKSIPEEQFTDYNMLYFANALKDLGLLNLDDKQFIGYFDNLLIKPTTPQTLPTTDTQAAQSAPQAPVSLREEGTDTDQPESSATPGQTFSLGGGFSASNKEEATAEKDQEKAATTAAKTATPAPQAATTQDQSIDNQEADQDQEDQPAQPPIAGSAPLPTTGAGSISTPQSATSAEITTEQEQKTTQEIDKKIPVETAAQSGQVAKITPAQQVVQMPKGQGRMLQTQAATNQKTTEKLEGSQPDQQQKNIPENTTTTRRNQKNKRVAKGMPFAAKVGLGVGGGGFSAIMGTMFFSNPAETTALLFKFLA